MNSLHLKCISGRNLESLLFTVEDLKDLGCSISMNMLRLKFPWDTVAQESWTILRMEYLEWRHTKRSAIKCRLLCNTSHLPLEWIVHEHLQIGSLKARHKMQNYTLIWSHDGMQIAPLGPWCSVKPWQWYTWKLYYARKVVQLSRSKFHCDIQDENEEYSRLSL